MRKLLSALIAFLFLATSSITAYPAALQIGFLLSQVRSTTYGALAGGLVYFYEAGTTTAKTIYTDRAKATPAANPYTLDSDGTALLYGDGLYRIVIKTSAGVTVYDRDNLMFQDLSGGFTGDDSGTITGYTFGDGTDNAVLNDVTINGTLTVSGAFHRGALVYRSSTQALPDDTTTSVLFNAEDYDTDSIHSTSTNTDRLTVPAGVTKIRLTAQLRVTTDANPTLIYGFILKNGTDTYNGYTYYANNSVLASGGINPISFVTPVFSVSPGDYFTVSVNQDSDDAGVISTSSWFAMEIVP